MAIFDEKLNELCLDFVDEINAEDVHAREMGMGGVPGFILNRKFFVSGAQPVAAFHKLFDLIQNGEAG